MCWSKFSSKCAAACLAVACAMPVAHARPQTTTSAGDASALGVPIDADILAAMRGGEDTVSVDVGNLGNVDGNTATDVVTGDNLIGGGAFAQAAGINTVIQNSGANVLIQNGTAVSVQFVNPSP